MLFPQLAALLWTAAALDTAAERDLPGPRTAVAWFGRLPTLAGLAMLTGYGGVAYALIANRLPASYFWPAAAFRNARPDVDRDLRAAYEWANGHLTGTTILQHNPLSPRVFNFGLYSRRRVAVSDGQAQLFGAGDEAVEARRARLGTIFVDALDAEAVRARASADGVDALVVSAQDPIWARRASWVWSSMPAYGNRNARIIIVRSLKDPPR
jgi:hypothetical protein